MLWWKAFHIIFVVAWFAGLFYLPRLFVYHAQTDEVSGHQRFVVMERRLFALMTIAAIATLISGGWLALPLWPYPAWLWWKLGVVGVLLVHHGLCWHYLRMFAAGANRRSHGFYRLFNEIPTLALISAVLLVVLKRP